MHSILFAVKRFFIFLTDCVVWPFTNFAELWRQPDRGRALILGLPGIVIGLISLLAVLYAIYGSKRQFVKSYNVAAKEAQEQEEWTDAIAHLRKLSDLMPKDNTIKLRLAEVLRLDNNEESRSRNLRMSESIMRMLAPNTEAGDPDAHVYRAHDFLRVRPLSQVAVNNAEKQLRYALETDETHHNARLELAKLLVAQRNFPEAEELYRSLFKDRVGYIFPLLDVLRYQQKLEDAKPLLEEAIQRYQRMLEEDKDNVDYMRRLANCYVNLGEFQTALDVLIEGKKPLEGENEVQLIDISLSNVYLSWASHWRRQDHLLEDDATRARYFELLRNSYESFPENVSTRVELTQLGLMKKDPESAAARDIYDAFADPDNAPPDVLLRIGTDQIINGDRGLGISLLEKGLEKNPNQQDILNNLAFALMEDDAKRALSLIDRALKISPNNAHFRDTRGNVLMRLNEYSRAIGDFEQALLDPVMEKNEKVYEAIIECYKQQQMFSDADLYQRKLDELKEGGGEDDATGESTDSGAFPSSDTGGN